MNTTKTIMNQLGRHLLMLLNDVCHTSERCFEGTIYTISDQRHPSLNGKQILVALDHGQNHAEWVDDPSTDIPASQDRS